jgi:hypothetical protein
VKQLFALIFCSTALIHAAAAPTQAPKRFAEIVKYTAEQIVQYNAAIRAVQKSVTEFEAFAKGKAPAECDAKATALQLEAVRQWFVLKKILPTESSFAQVDLLFNVATPLARVMIEKPDIEGFESAFVQVQLLQSNRRIDLCFMDDCELPSAAPATTSAKATDWKASN